MHNHDGGTLFLLNVHAAEMVLTTVGFCITLYSGNLLVHIDILHLFQSWETFIQPQYDMGMKWWTVGIFKYCISALKWSSSSLNSHQLKALLSTYTSISLNIYNACMAEI